MPGKTLNPRYLHFHPTVAAQTAQSAPTTVSLDCGTSVWLQELHIVIPKGHAGLTGLQITYSGTPILPYGSASGYLIGNQFEDKYDMGNLGIDTPLIAVMFNTDYQVHGFDIIAKVFDIPSTTNTTQVAAVIM